MKKYTENTEFHKLTYNLNFYSFFIFILFFHIFFIFHIAFFVVSIIHKMEAALIQSRT